MSLLRSTSILVFALSCLNITSQNTMITNHKMTNTSTTKSSTVKQHQITIKKGSIFLIISSITKPNSKEAMNSYFEKVFPIALKYDFKPLANLPIDKIVAGGYKPNNFFGLYSWPDKDSVASFLQELPNTELKLMRTKIWEELKQVATTANQDFSLTFYTDKVYEILMLYDKKQLKEKNIKKHNGKLLLYTQVSGYEDLTSSESPNRVAIIEWNSEKEARTYKYHAYGSLNNEEAFYTHISIPEKN